MKIKQILYLIALAAAFTSCLSKNDSLFESTYITWLGTVENPMESNLFTFAGDDGITYYIRETNFPEFKPKTDTRLFLVYNLLSKNETTKECEIRLVDGRIIPTSDLLPLTKAVADTVGKDPVLKVDMYIARNFLNVNFSFYVSGNVIHTFNMVRPDTLIADNSLDTIKLEFRHNAHYDIPVNMIEYTMCFNISELQRFSVNPDSVPLVISWFESTQAPPKKINLMYKFFK